MLTSYLGSVLHSRQEPPGQDRVDFAQPELRHWSNVPTRMSGADLDVVEDEVVRDVVPVHVLSDLVTAPGSLGGQHPTRLGISARRQDGRAPIGMKTVLRKAGRDEGRTAVIDAPRRRDDHLSVELLHQGGNESDLDRVAAVFAGVSLIADRRYDAVHIEIDRQWLPSILVQEANLVPCRNPAFIADAYRASPWWSSGKPHGTPASARGATGAHSSSETSENTLSRSSSHACTSGSPTQEVDNGLWKFALHRAVSACRTE